MAVFDPNDEENRPHAEGNIAAITVILVLIILAIVFVLNFTGNKKKNGNQSKEEPQTEATIEMPEQESTNKRTSQELDIWELDFGKQDEYAQITQAGTELVTSVPPHSNEILITYKDGTSQYVPVNPKLTKNKYDDASFVFQRPMMKYYTGGVKTSYAGLMLSDEYASINYKSLVDEGFSFVMIRAGYRNERNGQLVADKKFDTNLRSALSSELQVGIYFEGQADDIVYVREEAEFLVELLNGREITYPVVYCIDPSNESVDTEDHVGKNLRTDNLLVFFNIISAEGYVPMLGANKEMLVMKVDLTALSSYKIWLMEPGDIPAYPYTFSVWSYLQGATIDGLGGKARLLIAMEDLTVRTVTKEI